MAMEFSNIHPELLNDGKLLFIHTWVLLPQKLPGIMMRLVWKGLCVARTAKGAMVCGI